MNSIPLDQGRKVIAIALSKARDLALRPLTVAVLDAGGHLIALEREDGSSNPRPESAIAKASPALALGVSSRKVAEMAAERPSFIAALGPLSHHGMVPTAGGLLILGGDGTTLGAIGITGDTSDNDETCAVTALVATGLMAQGS